DVTDTLELALTASGCGSAKVVHKPRLLTDNGSSYVSGDLAAWLQDCGMVHVRGAPCHPQTQGKIERDAQEPHSARELLPAWRSRSSDRALRRALQLQALPRKLTEPHPGRRLLRQRKDHPSGTRKDQTRHHQTATIATPLESRLNSNPNEPEPPFQYSSDCPKAYEDGQLLPPRGMRAPN